MDIKSATVVDFGCGDGTIGLGVADNFSPKMVVGDEIKGHMRNSAVPVQQHKNFHLRQYSTLNKVTADEILKMGIDAGFTVKKAVCSKVGLEPPASLIEQHGIDVLLTNEIRVLFKKENPYSPKQLALKAKRFAIRAIKSLTR